MDVGGVGASRRNAEETNALARRFSDGSATCPRKILAAPLLHPDRLLTSMTPDGLAEEFDRPLPFPHLDGSAACLFSYTEASSMTAEPPSTPGMKLNGSISERS
jgi:hypothetical protein